MEESFFRFSFLLNRLSGGVLKDEGSRRVKDRDTLGARHPGQWQQMKFHRRAAAPQTAQRLSSCGCTLQVI